MREDGRADADAQLQALARPRLEDYFVDSRLQLDPLPLCFIGSTLNAVA